MLGLDPATLEATVQEFNNAVQPGTFNVAALTIAGRRKLILQKRTGRTRLIRRLSSAIP